MKKRCYHCCCIFFFSIFLYIHRCEFSLISLPLLNTYPWRCQMRTAMDETVCCGYQPSVAFNLIWRGAMCTLKGRDVQLYISSTSLCWILAKYIWSQKAVLCWITIVFMVLDYIWFFYMKIHICWRQESLRNIEERKWITYSKKERRWIDSTV